VNKILLIIISSKSAHVDKRPRGHSELKSLSWT